MKPIALMIAFIACSARAQNENSVVINEFVVNPAAGKEYVELLVVGNAVDLRGWTLSDVGTRAGSGGSSEGDYTLPNRLYLSSLPRGSYVVIELTTPASNLSSLVEDTSLVDSTPRRIIIKSSTPGVARSGALDISTSENLQLYAGARSNGMLIDQILCGSNSSYIVGATWGDDLASTTSDNINSGNNLGSNSGARFVPSDQRTYAGFSNNDSGASFVVDTASYGSPGSANAGVRDSILALVPPPTPVAAWPANRSIDQPTHSILTWHGVATAGSYRVQLAADSLFGSVIEDDSTITDTTRSVGPLANSTTYYWRVQGTNVAGTGGFSVPWNFTTVVAPPPAPVLLEPLDGSMNQPLRLILRWNKPSSADTYWLQMSPDTSFRILVFNDSTLTDTVRQVGPLSNDTRYYWRVSAKNRGGRGFASPTWNFKTTLAAPAVPELVSPAPGATDQPTTLVLKWSPSSGAETYRLQLARDSLFSSILIDAPFMPDTSRQVGPLLPGTGYYWRVSAQNVGGSSAYSSTRHFMTLVFRSVRITSPVANQIVNSSAVMLSLTKSNFVFDSSAIGETNEKGKGHLVLSVDGIPQRFDFRDQVAATRLTSGPHSLRIELVNNDHSPLSPPVIDSVSVTISDQAPRVELTPGGSMYLENFSSSLMMGVKPTHFRLVRNSNRNPVPGEGHYGVFLDDAFHHAAYDTMTTVTRLDSGLRRVRAELVSNDGSSLSPRVFDEIWLRVPANAPSVMLERPSGNDTIRAASFVVKVKATNFMLSPDSTVAPPGTKGGHYRVTLNGLLRGIGVSDTVSIRSVGPGPANVRVELVSYDHAPLSPAVFDEVDVWFDTPTSIGGARAEAATFQLAQNFPNPFSAGAGSVNNGKISTTIEFTVPDPGHVALKIYNLIGQQVAVLFDGFIEGGKRHRVLFEADGLPTGVYFARLSYGGKEATRKMLYVR